MYWRLLFDLDTYYQKRKIWNDAAILRLTILQECKIDQLLNHLRLEMTQYTPLIGLFESIENAAYLLISERNNLQQECSLFNQKIVNIVEQFYRDHPAFVQDNRNTKLIKLMSLIVSICTLGVFNHVTGRSIFGLFSSRIEADIKLKELLQSTTDMNKITLLEPSAPIPVAEVVENALNK